MSDQNDDDKQYEPTKKKLDDARKKGEVPRSTDLTTAAAYAGFAVVSFALGAKLMSQLGGSLGEMLARSPELSREVFSGGLQPTIMTLTRAILMAVTPWFAIPFLGVVAMIIVQNSFVVAPTKLLPKLNRISLLSNAKNKFGRNGFFEFAKSFAKLVVVSSILSLFLLKLSPIIIASSQLGPIQASVAMVDMSTSFVGLLVAVATAFGAVDFLWQKAEHTRKNRMSRKEMTDEAKQMDGDPHVKNQRRRKAQEIANNNMLSEVPSADVIIVNPQHFAVALKWSRASGSAPICIAKGKGEIAARIREIAQEHAVPIRRDPPTARALFSTVEIGAQIHSHQFKAVAAAIRFSDEMRRNIQNRKNRS